MGLLPEVPWRIGREKGISERIYVVRKRDTDFEQQEPYLMNTE